jgi:hypothetical protein
MSPEARTAEAFVTQRSAFTMSVLITVACVLAIVNSPVPEHPLLVARILSVAWALVNIGVLVALRKKPRLWVARTAFAVVPLPLFPTFWLVLGERTLHALPYETFVREEIMCIIYALDTPPSAAITLVVICAFTVDSLVLFLTVSPHPDLLAVQGWQPWTILIYGACAAALALFRAHRQRREVSLIVEAERAAALQRLGRAYLAMRDLINTPLQTLHVSLSLLTARSPAARPVTDAMRRSVERLTEVSLILANTSKDEWRSGMDAFDPVHALDVFDRERQGG